MPFNLDDNKDYHLDPKYPRNTLRKLESPRLEEQPRDRNPLTGKGIPELPNGYKGPGTYNIIQRDTKQLTIPEANPDQTWRTAVLSMPRDRNPLVATPRDVDQWREEVSKIPRPRNPMFEGN